jgi:hypothetical protein
MTLFRAAAVTALTISSFAHAQIVPQKAGGSFDLKLVRAGTEVKTGRTATGRMLIEKTYHGALTGKGTGEMLTAVTDTPGSAVYVAIERVSGTLNGKKGEFALHHRGTRSGGESLLSIAVVPDSGTDELTGIRGELAINIVDGQHFYEFTYTLPAK